MGASKKHKKHRAKNQAAASSVKEKQQDRPEGRKQKSGFSRFKQWCGRHRFATGFLTLLVIAVIAVGIVATVPNLRYATLGILIKKDISVRVMDAETDAPVTDVAVTIGEREARTDKDGQATVSDVAVGSYDVKLTKAHYKERKLSVAVPIFGDVPSINERLTATGRVVQITTIDRISGSVIADAFVDAGDGQTAVANDKGVASLVVAADRSETPVSISAKSYRTAKTVVKKNSANTASLVKEGSIFYLSKKSGTIDVVKSNFDGSDRRTIVKGTGNEDDGSTTLFASRDWKYLALHAKRDDPKSPSLYIIDAASGQVRKVEQPKDRTVNIVGWHNHSFIFTATMNRQDQYHVADASRLNSVDATSLKVTTLDRTAGTAQREGQNGASDEIANVYIIDNQLVYSKSWIWSHQVDAQKALLGRQSSILSIRPDGTDMQVLQSYPAQRIGNIDAKPYKPQEIHYRFFDQSGQRIENYMTVDGKLQTVPPAEQKFDQDYPTFLLSPDGKRSFWAEERDGKNAIFVGGKNAENKQQIAEGSEYTPYGWLTDGYILLQKSGSELFITTISQLKQGKEPLKVSDYHKAKADFRGYGYGYGGQ